jgi:hypothetical protein
MSVALRIARQGNRLAALDRQIGRHVDIHQ